MGKCISQSVLISNYIHTFHRTTLIFKNLTVKFAFTQYFSNKLAFKLITWHLSLNLLMSMQPHHQVTVVCRNSQEFDTSPTPKVTPFYPADESPFPELTSTNMYKKAAGHEVSKEDSDTSFLSCRSNQ